MADIDVILMTWPNHPKRREYLVRTYTALKARLRASEHNLNLICSSESEHDPAHPWQGDWLTQFCREEGIALRWRIGAASLGAGMNSALRLATSSYTLLVQDDYELLAPLDLSFGVRFLEGRPDALMIRYGYYEHPENGTQFAETVEGDFRRVRLDRPWAYGDDPALRRRDWLDVVGPYREGPPHGMSEGDMFHRLIARRTNIFARERNYFGHFGVIAAVPDSKEMRPRAVRRSEL